MLNLSGEGGYNEHDIKEDATWQKCTSIDWTEVASEPTIDGKLQLPALQRTDFVGDVHFMEKKSKQKSKIRRFFSFFNSKCLDCFLLDVMLLVDFSSFNPSIDSSNLCVQNGRMLDELELSDRCNCSTAWCQVSGRLVLCLVVFCGSNGLGSPKMFRCSSRTTLGMISCFCK